MSDYEHKPLSSNSVSPERFREHSAMCHRLSTRQLIEPGESDLRAAQAIASSLFAVGAELCERLDRLIELIEKQGEH